ncbi:MAG: response regulator [Planctomycetota bacterium]
MTSEPTPLAPDMVPPGTRVLCVDDESMIGELVSEVLRSHLRCEVHNTKNGEEALEAISREPFDVIIVDYVMPKMNGGELYRRLRQDRAELLSRFMFITGDVLSEATLSHIASTGRPLLEKPFGLPELVAAISHLLAESRAETLPAADQGPEQGAR